MFGLCKVLVSLSSKRNRSRFVVDELLKWLHCQALALNLLNSRLPWMIFRKEFLSRWIRRFLKLENLLSQLCLKIYRMSTVVIVRSANQSLILLVTVLRLRVGQPPLVPLSDRRPDVWINVYFVLFWICLRCLKPSPTVSIVAEVSQMGIHFSVQFFGMLTLVLSAKRNTYVQVSLRPYWLCLYADILDSSPHQSFSRKESVFYKLGQRRCQYSAHASKMSYPIKSFRTFHNFVIVFDVVSSCYCIFGVISYSFGSINCLAKSYFHKLGSRLC